MTISEIDEHLRTLGKNEKLVVSKTTDEKKPPFIVLGNGKTTKGFKQDVVIDALAVFGELSPSQQKVVLLMRDELIRNQMNASQRRTELDNPNEVHLSHTSTDEDSETIKRLLRSNANKKALEDKKIFKKIRMNVYMLNPYMFIPPYKFSETAMTWGSLEHRPTSNPEETTPELRE